MLLVSVLDVLSHRAGVSIALSAAGVSADIRFPRDVRLHVLGTVARVVELFRAALVVALVRFLSGVGPDVQLEILETGERPRARGVLAPVRLLSRVAAKVSDELVSRIKGLLSPRTVLPEADILVHGDRMPLVKVTHQRLEDGKFLIAVLPAADKRTALFHVLFGEVGGRGGDGSECRLKEKGGASRVDEDRLLEERLLGGRRNA